MYKITSKVNSNIQFIEKKHYQLRKGETHDVFSSVFLVLIYYGTNLSFMKLDFCKL